MNTKRGAGRVGRTERQRREVELTCRVDGKEVSLEELARELVRCGGIVRK